MSMEFLPDDVAADEFEVAKRVYKGGPVGPRPRSEEQKPWDEAVQKAYDGTGIFAVQIAPEGAEDAKKRVDSAVRFLGLSTTAGLPKPGRIEGTVILTWKIRLPKKRASKKAVETPEDTPTASAE